MVHMRVSGSNESIPTDYLGLAMLILLLLFSGGACDWVEISQNHYRKEPTRKLVNFDHTTKSNRIYRNNSVTEKQWHRGAVDKVTNAANIRRVQYPSVKTSSLTTRHEDNRFDNNFNDHADTTEAEYNFISMKPNIQKFNMHEEDDELENLSKVTFSWTTTASIDHAKRPNPKLHTTEGNYFDHRKIFAEKESVGENNVQNNIKQAEFGKPRLPESNKHVDKVKFNENDEFHTLENPNFHRISHEDDEVKTVSPMDTENRYSNNTAAKQLPKIKLIQREDNDNFKDDVSKKQLISNTEYSDTEKYKPHGTSSHPLEEYFNTRNQFGNHNIHRSDYNIKNIEEMVTVDANPDVPVSKVEIAQIRDDKETVLPKPEDSRLNLTKGNSLKGMWKLLKIVADAIYKNTHRSFKSKITYLENLKSTVLTSIKDQIDSAWPDDARGASRAARAARPRGHVEFPSSESTLMTISFLTFAVFLIKLVLQIIHTYKNKAMMVTPAVVAAVGRAAAAFKSPK